MELSSVNRVDPSCSHPINNELNYFCFFQDNLTHPSDAEDTLLSSDHHQKKEDLVALSLFCTFRVKIAVQATMQKRPQSHDGSTRFTEDNSTYPAGKCLPLHNLNFFLSFSILVYNNTIISLRLIVYYLIIANSALCPSFAIYQTIYDSPLRDNCKIVEVLNDQNLFTESNLDDSFSGYVRWSFLRRSCSCSVS